VNIALIEDHQPVMGVLAIPVTGEIYFSLPGKGAFLKKDDAEIVLPRHKAADISKERIRVVASRSHMNEETQSFIQSLKSPELVSKGSSLKFMMLAEGKADIYPRFGPTMEWDTAAAHAIIKELGWSVVNANSGLPLTYNKQDLLNPYFICK
jgi:3'(2'), 5'-bisphosphate nucleotidase